MTRSSSRVAALLPLLLAATAILSCSAGRVPGNGVIRNGALKRDVNGEEMDAHDGNVVQWAPGQPYYMYSIGYGRDAQSAFSDLNPDPPIAGLVTQNPGGPANASLCDLIQPVNGQGGTRFDHNISIWTSPDLTDGSWELVRREGLPLATRPLGLYYRPKVIYNKLTSKYVLWGYYCSTAVQTGPTQNCVYYNAVSASPGGPFQVATANASIDGSSNADDFDLHVDDDGRAYIVYDQNLASLRVAPLTPDFLAFDVSVPPSVLVDGNYEAPAVFKRRGVYYFTYGWIVCFGLRGAGVSVKTSTNIMGPYSPVAYDVGCRGDTYTPDGPCYGTLLAQQAWVTKVQTCNSSSSQEQWLWVGDQWLSVGSNPKTFGNSRQAWVPLTFDDSVSPPRIQKQIAAVDPANGIAADILVRDGCLVTACGQDPNPLVCVPKAISAISASSSSVAGGGLQDAVECLTKFCSLDAKLAAEVRACVSRKPLVPQELAACVAGVHKG